MEHPIYSLEDVKSALCVTLERERSLNGTGLIFVYDDNAHVLRYPSSIFEPYIYCTTGSDIRTATPTQPSNLRWRMPWTPSDSRFDVPYNPSTSGRAGSPETTHDVANFGIDVIVLCVGVTITVMTGGIGAAGAWGALQIGSGVLLSANDGIRTVSDFVNHGAIGQFEDHS